MLFMRSSFSYGLQANAENGAFSHLRIEIDCAAVRFHDLPDQAQSHARTFDLAGNFTIAAVEFLENVFPVFGGNAVAAIADADGQLPPLGFGFAENGRSGRRV